MTDGLPPQWGQHILALAMADEQKLRMRLLLDPGIHPVIKDIIRQSSGRYQDTKESIFLATSNYEQAPCITNFS